uniref:PB1-like domain-containing protein n=1 Tax=Chenopodium quinoa TaxID=63459 RepID=A0A803KTZ9_CHEQI
MWHGGVFQQRVNGVLCYMNGQNRTFDVDPDELCSFYLVELVMKCARYDGRIQGFLYLVPGLSMEDRLRRVTDDDKLQPASSKQKTQPKSMRAKKLPIKRGPPVRCSPRKKSNALTLVEPSQKALVETSQKDLDSSLKPKEDAPTELITIPPTISPSNKSTCRIKYVINPSTTHEIAHQTLENDPVNTFEWEDSRPESPIPINDLIPEYSSDSDTVDPSYNPLVGKGKGVSSKPFFGEVGTDDSGEDSDDSGEEDLLHAELDGGDDLVEDDYASEEAEDEPKAMTGEQDQQEQLWTGSSAVKKVNVRPCINQLSSHLSSGMNNNSFWFN